MTSQFESIMTGVAGHIGNYADAVRIPTGVELIHTSGTPGLNPDGTRTLASRLSHTLGVRGFLGRFDDAETRSNRGLGGN